MLDINSQKLICWLPRDKITLLVYFDEVNCDVECWKELGVDRCDSSRDGLFLFLRVEVRGAVPAMERHDGVGDK